MNQLYHANTYFEEELSSPLPKDPKSTICSAPKSLILQFLPFFYAQEDGEVLLSHTPDSSYLNFLRKFFKIPKIELIENKFTAKNLNLWGASQKIEHWAKKRGCIYDFPQWNLIKNLQSKQFCFENTDRPEGSQLLFSLNEIEKWVAKSSKPLLLKKVWGSAGRGHLLLPNPSLVESFVKEEFLNGRPIIGEPFLQRILDFSTQWFVHQSGIIEYLGVVEQLNSLRGHYKGSIIDDDSPLIKVHEDQLQAHKDCVQKFLKKIQAMGFFGNVGVDAMIYDGNRLFPIVEINLRKTMGYVALMCRNLYFPKKKVIISSEAGDIPLLPSQIRLSKSKTQNFKTQLYLTVQ